MGTWVEIEKADNKNSDHPATDKILGEWCKYWKVRFGLRQGNESTRWSLWFCSVKAFAFYPSSLNNCGESNSDTENLIITWIFTRNSFWFSLLKKKCIKKYLGLFKALPSFLRCKFNEGTISVSAGCPAFALPSHPSQQLSTKSFRRQSSAWFSLGRRVKRVFFYRSLLLGYDKEGIQLAFQIPDFVL